MRAKAAFVCAVGLFLGVFLDVIPLMWQGVVFIAVFACVFVLGNGKGSKESLPLDHPSSVLASGPWCAKVADVERRGKDGVVLTLLGGEKIVTSQPVGRRIIDDVVFEYTHGGKSSASRVQLAAPSATAPLKIYFDRVIKVNGAGVTLEKLGPVSIGDFSSLAHEVGAFDGRVVSFSITGLNEHDQPLITYMTVLEERRGLLSHVNLMGQSKRTLAYWELYINARWYLAHMDDCATEVVRQQGRVNYALTGMFHQGAPIVTLVALAGR